MYNIDRVDIRNGIVGSSTYLNEHKYMIFYNSITTKNGCILFNFFILFVLFTLILIMIFFDLKKLPLYFEFKNFTKIYNKNFTFKFEKKNVFKYYIFFFLLSLFFFFKNFFYGAINLFS